MLYWLFWALGALWLARSVWRGRSRLRKVRSGFSESDLELYRKGLFFHSPDWIAEAESGLVVRGVAFFSWAVGGVLLWNVIDRWPN
jgi:hypothetical protein